MKIRNIFYPLLAVILITACRNQPAKKTVLDAAVSAIQKDSSIIDSTSRLNEENYLAFKTLNYEGYAIKYRYLKHETGEEGSGENPALLQVYKNEKLIFTDSFKAEGDMYIDTLGYHAVSGQKLFFILNYGIEACDYAQTGRYYFISPESGVHYLKDFYAGCGGDGYSCKSYKHYFPGDSSGITDGFRVIDALRYNKHEQPDKFDTIDWQFEKDKCKITKQTHHLSNTGE
jgi:hypothetical protein